MLTLLMQAGASHLLVDIDHVHAGQALCAKEIWKARSCMVNAQCLVDPRANKLSPLDCVGNANVVVYGIYPKLNAGPTTAAQSSWTQTWKYLCHSCSGLVSLCFWHCDLCR